MLELDYTTEALIEGLRPALGMVNRWRGFVRGVRGPSDIGWLIEKDYDRMPPIGRPFGPRRPERKGLITLGKEGNLRELGDSLWVKAARAAEALCMLPPGLDDEAMVRLLPKYILRYGQLTWPLEAEFGSSPSFKLIDGRYREFGTEPTGWPSLRAWIKLLSGSSELERSPYTYVHPVALYRVTAHLLRLYQDWENASQPDWLLLGDIIHAGTSFFFGSGSPLPCMVAHDWLAAVLLAGTNVGIEVIRFCANPRCRRPLGIGVHGRRKYCSDSCANLVRVQKFRRSQKK